MVRILVSNDDGVNARGIRVLTQSLASIADTITVAPDRNRSGASNSLTLEVPLRVQEVPETGFYSVKGTPTDCVHIAVSELIKPEPDMVVSGINHGANLGDDVIYSGTVAAATEGRHLGLPSVAVSLDGSTHFQTAGYYAKKIVQTLLTHSLPSNQILNVNVPDLPIEEVKGIKITRLGNRHRSEAMIQAEDPRGQKVYWVGPPGKKEDAGEGTDFDAVDNGYVSITPLCIDMTAHSSLDLVSNWLQNVD